MLKTQLHEIFLDINCPMANMFKWFYVICAGRRKSVSGLAFLYLRQVRSLRDEFRGTFSLEGHLTFLSSCNEVRGIVSDANQRNLHRRVRASSTLRGGGGQIHGDLISCQSNIVTILWSHLGVQCDPSLISALVLSKGIHMIDLYCL